MPDESIWHHPQMLKDHWDAVKQRRDSSSGGSPMETVPLTDNDLAKEISR